MTDDELKAALEAFRRRRGIPSARRVRDLYAVRQVLARLQASPHAGRFQLKGGMFVGAVLDDFHRATRDADVLGQGPPDPAAVKALFEEAVSSDLQDGVDFRQVKTRRATRDADGYDGVKVEIAALVANTPATAWIDIG